MVAALAALVTIAAGLEEMAVQVAVQVIAHIIKIILAVKVYTQDLRIIQDQDKGMTVVIKQHPAPIIIVVAGVAVVLAAQAVQVVVDTVAQVAQV
jgi:hypothetical protein